MEPAGSVIIVETVMPETAEPHPAKFLDVNMLALTERSTERTESEFRSLCEAAGLSLKAIHPTKTRVSIVEAVKA